MKYYTCKNTKNFAPRTLRIFSRFFDNSLGPGAPHALRLASFRTRVERYTLEENGYDYLKI